MTLEELLDQQQRDIRDYEEASHKSWAALKDKHNQFATSFGGADKLPVDLRKQIDKEIEEYRKEWSMYTGYTHKAIIAKHNKQRELFRGVHSPKKEPSPKEINPLNDNKQEKLQKIIAQQQAIRNRKPQQKRK
jgi:hypothetical protein